MATSSSLGLSTSFLPGHDTRLRRRRHRRSAGIPAASFRPAAELGAEVGRQLVEAVGVGLPCTVMACGDVIYRSTLPHNDGLTITAPGAALALAAASYLWATPGVAPGFFDMFVLAFAERLYRPTFRKDDLVPGKKLGEGAFGVVYKASLSDPKAAEKQGAVVVKKATEYGAVEIWMNERVRRACASSCADFLYGFRESKAKGKGADEYWLIWRYEGEDTLSALMQSKEFPYNDCVIADEQERKYAIVRASDLQLSILIMGVGNADFTQMRDYHSSLRI